MTTTDSHERRGQALKDRYPILEGTTLEDLHWCHEADRKQEVFALERDPESYYEVKITGGVPLERYREETPAPMWEMMEAEMAPLVGKRGFVLSSTFEGGGVAMQEPPALGLMQQMGADVHWLVSEPMTVGELIEDVSEQDSEAPVFDTTKKMHNLQQDVLSPDVQFTEEDKAIHKAYGVTTFRRMMERVEGFAEADFYWIEDPQLAAMIPELMRINPNAKFIYRNHIQTDRDKMAQDDSPQNRIYTYLRDECRVGDVDTYVAHPVEQFVPYDTPNVAYMPPTSELREDLNRPVSPREREDKKHWMDGQVTKQNLLRQATIRKRHLEATGEEPSNELLHSEDQPLINWNRKLLTGFARFDRAKGQEYNLKLQLLITRRLRQIGLETGMDVEDLIPHSVVAGNGATDDPDRNVVLAEMIGLTKAEYAEISQYVTVVGLEHDYAAVNVLLRESMFTENFSTKEGFEHRRAEGMLKEEGENGDEGVPSLSTNAGGLPLQGLDGQGGFVADLEHMDEELERIADEVVADLLEPARHLARRKATHEWSEQYIKPELTTLSNVFRFSRIVNGNGDRRWKLLDLLPEYQAKKLTRVRKLGGEAVR
jgi:trehalose synthase